MTIKDLQSLPQPDGSTAYIVNNIYTALPGDPMWQSIQDWLAAGNMADAYKPPEAKPIDPDVQLTAEIMADYIDTQKATKKWQDRAIALKAGKNSGNKTGGTTTTTTDINILIQQIVNCLVNSQSISQDLIDNWNSTYVS
jgi:hypothetical protein